MGYDGTGVVVGSLDSGTRWTHEALKPRYRGWNGTTADHNYNWWDPVSQLPAPYDPDGHGTHTMGTILGVDLSANPDRGIGVAPGARWISTNGIATGSEDSDIIESGEFLLAPWDLTKQNPDPSKRPVVVSNSWGHGPNTPACPGGEPLVGEFFRQVVGAWIDAGIFPSFSAGNGFPQGNRVPAAYPETFETGALSKLEQKASYSSQGPSCFDQGQHPQIMAYGGDEGPGLTDDYVRSSYNGSDTEYEYSIGTSMAQPATAGAIAILKQANPDLTIPETWYILTSTASFDPAWLAAGPRPNQIYGWGRLQIDAAVQAALASAEPTVTGTPPTATNTSTPTITRTPTNTALPTATPVCSTSYNSTDVNNKLIVDFVPVTSNLVITNGQTIADLDVININIEHTWPSDLVATLKSPSGTVVELFSNVCGDVDWTEENTGFTLSDQASILICEQMPLNQGTYEPENPLSTFNGQPSTGTWTLTITDTVEFGNGTLNGWGLRVSSNEPCGTTFTATATGTSTTTGTPTATVTGTPPTATQTLTATATSVLTSTLTPTQMPSQTATSTGVVPSATMTLVATGTSTGTTTAITATATNVNASATTTTTPPNTATRTTTSTTVPVSSSSTATRTATSTTASVTSTTTATACPIEFQDVPPSTEEASFYPFVQCLACRGIVSGYPCGGTNPETGQAEPCGDNNKPYYRPANQITRGQISKVVAGASGASGDPGPQKYEDVPPGSTFYQWINRLSNEGVMGGYPCGSPGEPCRNGNRPYFRPNANATRGQMSKIVSNAAGFDESASGQSFEDLPPDNSPSSYYVYVERLFVRGIVGGYPCGGAEEECGEEGRPYFRPNSPVTRGQAAKIAANTFFPQCSNTTRP
ncbi:MAG TPA: S8 family serine peptidase, partial [Chloroflexia bacterium]